MTAPQAAFDAAVALRGAHPLDAIPYLAAARTLIEKCRADLQAIERAIPGGHDADVYQRDEAGEAIRAAVAGLTDLLGDTIAPAITAIEQAREAAEPVEPVASLRAHAYPGRF